MGDHFGIILASFWGSEVHSGIILASFSDVEVPWVVIPAPFAVLEVPWASNLVSLSTLGSSWGDFAVHFGGSCGTWGTLWGQIGVIFVLFSSTLGAKSLENVRIVVSMRLSLFAVSYTHLTLPTSDLV